MDSVDEELGSTGVGRSCVCHRECARLVAGFCGNRTNGSTVRQPGAASGARPAALTVVELVRDVAARARDDFIGANHSEGRARVRTAGASAPGVRVLGVWAPELVHERRNDLFRASTAPLAVRWFAVAQLSGNRARDTMENSVQIRTR
eukprot:COSAG02_NODE_2416_length_8909_cov_10.038252_2_plen_148_part_00